MGGGEGVPNRRGDRGVRAMGCWVNGGRTSRIRHEDRRIDQLFFPFAINYKCMGGPHRGERGEGRGGRGGGGEGEGAGGHWGTKEDSMLA